MTEEFSLWWKLRHWLALKIGGIHIAHREKTLNEAIEVVEGWRKTNAALERASERLEELLKEACHDLENVGMSGKADYLLEQAGLEEKKEE